MPCFGQSLGQRIVASLCLSIFKKAIFLRLILTNYIFSFTLKCLGFKPRASPFTQQRRGISSDNDPFPEYGFSKQS